jgi:uncharacterized protein (TIGR00251 family)
MIALEERADGVLLAVKAQPGARQNALRGEHNGMLKVSVTQAPEKGKANQAIIEVLARELGLKRGQIELIGGETASQKKFLVRDCSLATLSERIKLLLPETESRAT